MARPTNIEPILQLIDAIVQYRRAQERQGPVDPKLWHDICRYMDVILLTGTDQALRERFAEKDREL